MGQIFLWVAFPVFPVLLPYGYGNIFSTSRGATPQAARLVCPFQVLVNPSVVTNRDPHALNLSFLLFHILIFPPSSSYEAAESKYSFSFPSRTGEEGCRFFLPCFCMVGGGRRSD